MSHIHFVILQSSVRYNYYVLICTGTSGTATFDLSDRRQFLYTATVQITLSGGQTETISAGFRTGIAHENFKILLYYIHIRQSVDCLCVDGASMPIVRLYTLENFLNTPQHLHYNISSALL